MVSKLSLLVVVALSILVTRIASVVLTHTGLSSETARFQARSARCHHFPEETPHGAPAERPFPMSLLNPGSGFQAEAHDRLVDFPASLQDLPWRVVDDDVMGGRSRGHIRTRETTLVFEGTTNTDGGGFSSIRSARRSFDLADSAGIRLRVRGDGRTYTFRLTSAATRGRPNSPAYWAELETAGDGWEVVDVPFERFRPRWRGQWLPGPQLDRSAIDSLGLLIYDGRDGPFRLEVDWIGSYQGPASQQAIAEAPPARDL